MYKISVLEQGYIFDNPLPQLRSRHGYFPNVIKLKDGRLMAAFRVGEAFESVDLTTTLAKSHDGGRNWNLSGPLINKERLGLKVSDSFRLTDLGGGRLTAFGSWYKREDEDLPIGNPKTGGVLDNEVVLMRSSDNGATWSDPVIISTSFKEPVEASAPLTLLKNGWLAAPITNMQSWDGSYEKGPEGRLLISKDDGASWSDDTVTMKFPQGRVTVYEQRICQLDDGRIVVIAWNEDVGRGIRLPNHFAISGDNGKSFSEPASTGIMGQASNVTYLGGNRILALHCIRRDTDKPGIYGYIVDLSKNSWDISYETMIWGPDIPIRRSNSMAEVFAYLRFGQPSAIHLHDDEYLMVNWVIEEGQGKVVWRRLDIRA